MIVWGGERGGGAVAERGAIYHTREGAWREMSSRGAPRSRAGHGAVFDGTRMLVWGGTTQAGLANDGGAYDPRADAWHPLAAAPIPGRRDLRLAWLTDRMVVWGGTDGAGREYPRDGAVFTP
jgi:hypothetical protein